MRAPITGVVERIGFAYRGDERYRYVELADAATRRDVRVLYVGPIVELGATVEAGAPIGRAQDLGARYPRGITNHVHVEVRENGALADPTNVLPGARQDHDGAVTSTFNFIGWVQPRRTNVKKLILAAALALSAAPAWAQQRNGLGAFGCKFHVQTLFPAARSS